VYLKDPKVRGPEVTASSQFRAPAISYHWL